MVVAVVQVTNQIYWMTLCVKRFW